MPVNSFFDTAPERFFSPFASPNRRIYEAAMYILREEYSVSEDMCLLRTRITSLLASSLPDSLQSGDFTEDENEYGRLDEDEIRNRIYYVIRNLIRAGWLEEMVTDKLEEAYYIPPYANSILKGMLSIADKRSPRYESLAYTIYSVLSKADEEKNGQSMIAALDSAFEDTVTLQESLRTNINTMRRAGRMITLKEDADDIYAAFREEFQHKIVEEYINPLISMKNQKWYENRILNILGEWFYNDYSFFLIEQRLKTLAPDEETFQKERAAIREKLQKTIDYYKHLSPLTTLMYSTQEKIMQQSLLRLKYRFTHGSGDDMLTLVNGILQTLKNEGESEFGRKLFAALSESWNFTSASYADTASLYSNVRDDSEDGENIMTPRPLPDEKQRAESLADFYSNIEEGYDDRIVIDALEKAPSSGVRASEMEINNIDDYSALLYAAVRGLSDDSPYESVWDEGFEEVEKGGFIITDYLFRMRKKD